MRRLVCALAAFAAACATPSPCTRALCPTRVDGTYLLRGWKGTVLVTPTVPPAPVISDVEVQVLSGNLEFVNNTALVRASAGALFHIEVSTQAEPTPMLFVSSGPVSVAQRSGDPFHFVTPGQVWALPRAPKPTLR